MKQESHKRSNCNAFKILIILCAVLACLNVCAAKMEIVIHAENGNLKGDKNLHPCSWLKEKANTMLIGGAKGAMNKWQRASFSFNPEKTGKVKIILKGPFDKKLKPEEYPWVIYDDVRVNGKLLPNGDFEDGFDNWKPNTWSKLILPPQIVDDPMQVKTGRKSVRAWHRGSVVTEIPVTAGKEVTIDLQFRPTENYSVKQDSIPLSLAKVANRGFVDEVQGDGKGGWSDYGPKHDFRRFDLSRKRFGSVGFDIVDPKTNNGFSIVTFDSKHDKTGVKEITLDVPDGTNAKFLYLLHSACECPRTGIIGNIEFIDAAGKSKVIPVEQGKDIRDWYKARNLPNGKVVCNASSAPEINKGINKGIYLSKFPVPSMNLKKVRFKTKGKATWILCGATISSQNIETSGVRSKVTPGPDYKAGDFAPERNTLSGSALDISTVGKLALAGQDGHIRLTANGTMEFEKRPGVPIRFKACYQFNWRRLREWLKSKSKEQGHKEIDKYVSELCRRGYNMVRVWPEDSVSLFAKADNQPCMDGVDLLDYFLSKLKENGIYVNLNIAANRLLYNWRKNVVSLGMKNKMLLGDPTIRKMWTDLARLLLCHKNPYTGMALKDDPMLVCVEPCNELAFGLIWLRRFTGAERTKPIAKKFKDFLLKKYGKLEFSTTEYPDENEGTYQKDWLEFCYNHISETTQWFREQLKELGCKAPMAQFNMTTQRFYGDIRYQYDDIVIKNAYFMHPTQYMKIGSQCRQTSAIQGCGDYFRRSIGARFADRPMIQTEYNHSFWNQYEYEQPLFPVYAAFQGYTGLTMHQVKINGELENAIDFSSLFMDTASEYLSSFFFIRGDITPSKNLTQLSIPKSSLFADGAGSSINMEQLKCAFLTRFGVKYEDTPRPELIRNLAEPKAAVTIPLNGFSEVKFSKMFSEEGVVKKSKFSLSKYIAELKKKGILSASNRSDPTKGIYESDTGEIYMDTYNKILTVETQYSEMLTSEKPTEESLTCIKHVNSNIPSTVALVSLDNKEPLKNSKHMLLFYMTSEMNTGMELSSDRVILEKVGTLPVLVRTGKLKLKLALDNKKSYSLYPLRSDGLRRKEIPLKQKNGLLDIELDTATFDNGPTMFFELVAK